MKSVQKARRSSVLSSIDLVSLKILFIPCLFHMYGCFVCIYSVHHLCLVFVEGRKGPRSLGNGIRMAVSHLVGGGN